MGLYCGIDLHSNNHVLTVIDEADRRVYERRLPNDLAITKAALEPHRAELVAVAVESTFNWLYGLPLCCKIVFASGFTIGLRTIYPASGCLRRGGP